MSSSKLSIAKRKEKTAETTKWTGLFQGELKTKHASLVFVKRMMAVAVSSITYLRGIFPEDAYRSRYLEDLCIKVLRDDCSTPGANKVVKWMMGCFDALEKQYVVFIGVYTNPNDPNCMIESYQFKFRYTEKGPQMNILRDNAVQKQITLEDTKSASTLLIRKLFLLMQNFGPLPNNIYLTMKLYYYDELTPADYEPPGFKEGECDSLWFEGMAVHFKVGDVQTPFHTLKVCLSAEQSRLVKLQEENQLRENKLMIDKCTSGKEGSHQKVCEEDFPSEDESAQFKKPTRPLAKRRATTKNKAKRKKKI